MGALAAACGTQIFDRPAQAAPPNFYAPCSEAGYHQLDFWIGRWDVYDPKGALVAHSLIEPVYGCGIRENWMPLGKQGGGSLSIYVPQARHWEQFWIDSSGSRRSLPAVGTAKTSCSAASGTAPWCE
jgi:hypothetical protein